MKVYSKHNYRKDEKFRGKRGYKRNRCTVMLNAFRKLSTRLLTEISKLEKFPLLNSSAVDVSFQLLEISPRPGTRAPLSAFVSFAHVHVHTIPIVLGKSLTSGEEHGREFNKFFFQIFPILLPSYYLAHFKPNDIVRSFSLIVSFCVSNKLKEISNKIENPLDKTWIIKRTRNKRSKYLWFNHLWLSYSTLQQVNKRYTWQFPTRSNSRPHTLS